MKGLDRFSLPQMLGDFRFAFEKNREALYFIREHRLWEGFWKFSWVMRLLVFAGLIASFKFYGILRNWYGGASTDDVLAVGQSIVTLFDQVYSEGYHFLFLGGFKYVVLLLVEIIVFHFVRRTLEIKTGNRQDFTPRTFIRAQIRMFVIVLRNFILETLLTVAVKTVMGIIGFTLLQTPLILLIQCYFLGFAMIDNYNELYGMSIRQSARTTQHYSGLALAVGMTTYFLLLIPLLGPFIAPFFVAVTATLSLHDLREAEGSWRYNWQWSPPS